MIMIISVIAIVTLIVETGFFLYFFQSVQRKIKNREKEYSFLDKERGELRKLQQRMESEIKELIEEGDHRLGHLKALYVDGQMQNQKWTQSLEQHKEQWQKLVQSSLTEYEEQRNGAVLHAQKVFMESEKVQSRLENRIEDIKSLISVVEKKVPTLKLVKDFESQRYSQARSLVEEGREPNDIARETGLSVGEVLLISQVKRK